MREIHSRKGRMARRDRFSVWLYRLEDQRIPWGWCEASHGYVTLEPDRVPVLGRLVSFAKCRCVSKTPARSDMQAVESVVLYAVVFGESKTQDFGSMPACSTIQELGIFRKHYGVTRGLSGPAPVSGKPTFHSQSISSTAQSSKVLPSPAEIHRNSRPA